MSSEDAPSNPSAPPVSSAVVPPSSPPSGPTTARRKPGPDETNVKETIESILIAFILAFVFRAFVVEAFVIPTGSMAPTLLGADMRYTCPDCGYQFDTNYNAPSETTDGDPKIDPEAYPPADIYCPNCGYKVAGPSGYTIPGTTNRESGKIPVHYGDRILVLKYVYLLHDPQRWDVVVFKSPDVKPGVPDYTMNYIKRLVGKPGESLMVLNGDIYISTAEHPQWQVQHKPTDVQEAMWRVVYDNDFHPQGLSRLDEEGQPRSDEPQWRQPWVSSLGSGWNVEATPASKNGRVFSFDNLNGLGELQFDPKANSTTQTLTDYLVYDTMGARDRGLSRGPGEDGSPDDRYAPAVSDLKLAVDYTRNSGDGPLDLSLVKHESIDHTFTAELTPSDVLLWHIVGSQKTLIGQEKLANLGIDASKPIYVELMNVDYHVTLRLNGHEALQPFDYAPNVDWLIAQWREHDPGRPGEAHIQADHQSCSLTHVGLWRDVYYTNRDNGGSNLRAATPDNPVHLGPGEYFVMGDNSEISGDARYWNQPINLPHEGLKMASGRVPAQFMLGQAVFVYWPAGYQIPIFNTLLSIIPNFGEMRWIH